MTLREKIIIRGLSWLGVKAVNITLVDYRQFKSQFIKDTIKRNGFVELNRSGGLFFMRGFTLLEIKMAAKIIGVSADKNKDEYISQVFIKHDIDSVCDTPIKSTEIKNKVSDLQVFLDYFNTI